MKQILIGLVALILATSLRATEKEITSTIKEVTVFRNGAQVNRTAKSVVPMGNSVLKFTGISAAINGQSIQFRSKGDFTVLSVTHQLNYFKEPEPKEETDKLRVDREKLTENLAREQTILQVYAEEESMILANKMIGSKEGGVDVDALKATAAFYHERMMEIRLAKLEQNKKIKLINKDIQKIDQQLNELNAKRKSISTSEILVSVSAKTAVSATFDISYLVSNASWTPTYDLRVKDISSPVKMDYKAKVIQHSGEDWKNVKLALSTGNPFVNATRPVISDWWLQFYQYNPTASRGRYKKDLKESQIYLDGEKLEEEAEYEDDLAPSAMPVVQVVENTTTTEFQIKEKYDIPSNGKAHVVSIQQHSLPATYEYYVAPKLDRDAFLTALVTDWDQYNLLSGESNLFFEGTYIGKSYLNVQETSDTFTLSLGRDKNIIVNRVKDKQYSDKQFIGPKKTVTIGWNISLRNKKQQGIKIIVEDQYPLSSSDQIEVNLENHKGAKVDKDKGRLRWELEMKPGEAKDLGFKYSVKYPKKKRLILE